MVSTLLKTQQSALSFWKYRSKGLILLVFLSICVAACAPTSANNGGVDTDDAEPRKGKLSSNFTLSELREIAEESDNSEIDDVEVTSIRTMNKDYKDVNPDLMLFDEELRSDDARFDRLENAVQDIHTNLESLTPSINRLVAIEEDMRDLHSKLSTLVEQGGGEPASAEQQSGPEPRRLSLNNSAPRATPPPPQPEPAAAPEPDLAPEQDTREEFLPSLPVNTGLSDSAQVSKQPGPVALKTEEGMQIRAWESDGKTRIVFESPAKGDYSVIYDAAGQVVTVQSSQPISVQQLQKMENTSSQIMDAETLYDTSTNMTRLTMKVDNVDDVSTGYYLPPEGNDVNHRYYFDIFK